MRKINYLEWAKRYMGRSRLDLARSSVKPITREELGLRLEEVALQRSETAGQELQDLLASRYGVPRDHVFLTNSATQGIFLSCVSALERGDEVLLENPNYEPLYRVLLHLGAEVKMLSRPFERGFQIDLEELERMVSRNTRAILLTNLHNPSGVATNPDRMETIGQIARDHSARVICSEVYLDAVLQDGHKPVATYGSHMVSIGSFSKVYGLPGPFLGWVVADPALLERVRNASDYIAGVPSGPTESIGLAVLRRSDELLRRCRTLVAQNVKQIRTWVQGRKDLQWIEPDGGTIGLVKLASGTDSLRLSELLREKYDTLVVPGDFFWLRGFLRICCGVDPDVLAEGLDNVSRALDELKSVR